MASSSLSTGIILTVFIAAFCGVFFQTLTNTNVDERVDLQNCGPFTISNFSGESFFRDDYFTARDLFLKSAKDAGAEMMFLPVVDHSRTEVAVLRGKDQSTKF